MIELVALLFIVAFSLLVVRTGAVALAKTGLSEESALFQSQSAFMLVGFTTTESESVVNHPVRRRIIRILMLLGFIAMISALGTLVVTFAQQSEAGMSPRTKLAIIVGGASFLVLLWTVRPFEHLLDTVITRALERMTDLHILDYDEMLKLNKGYTVAHITVDEACWLAGRELRDLKIADEGVLILSIQRSDGTVLGTPASTAKIFEGDKLLCYGLEGTIAGLGQRSCGAEGDRAHELARNRQRLRVVEERAEDEGRDPAEQTATGA